MDVDQTRALLSVVASLDRRLMLPDRDSADLRLAAWSNMLTEVTAQWAITHVQRYYSTEQQWAITPAVILGAWRAERAMANRREDDATDREHQAETLPRDVVEQRVDALRDASSTGQPATLPGTNVPPVLSPQHDVWERRCTYYRMCACDHRSCRGGWKDQEEEVTDSRGWSTTRVSRCQWCLDALLMATEQGVAKPVSTSGKRRA